MHKGNCSLEKGRSVVSYSTPLTETYYMSVQGILCGSYGNAGEPGKDLNVENEWDF